MPTGVSADHGGVAAGRDVVADLIVTGDSNTFFLGAYQALSEAYIDPGEVFDRVDVAAFVGREGLIAQVDEFLAANASGYFVVEAGAGLGKTALLAHLVKARGWVHHFSELAPGEAGIVPARMNLAAQLIRTYDLGEKAVSEAAASRPDFLRRLLADAAARLEDGEKLVFVVDALDEAGTRPGENVLGLPRTLPAGVFAVVSKRTIGVALFTESPRRVVQIDAASEDNHRDIRRFLEAVAPPHLVEPLIDHSQGVWVYVRYALQQGDLDPDTLPVGLWAWYHRFFSTWAAAHPGEWRRRHLPVLATLAAAREDLTLEELSELAGADPPLDELPGAWRPYLLVSRERPRRLRVHHASLADFLHGGAGSEDSAEQEFADDLADATRAAHGRIADRHPAPWDAYGLAHVPAHLRRAGRHAELFALVDAPAWRSAQLLRDPSAGGFLGSVTEAWDCATALDRDAIAAGERPEHLLREVTSALGAEDVHTFATYLPPPLLARLVAARIWSPDQALALAGLAPFPFSRARRLAVLIPYLPRPRVIEELRALFAWAPDDDRERVLGVLADDLPAELLPDALEFATGARESERADALGALAPRLPEELQEQALAAALAFDDEDERADALAGLIPHLAPPHRARAEAALIEAITALGGPRRSGLIERLGPEMPEALLRLVASIEDPSRRAHAVAELCPALTEEQRAEAVGGAIAPDRDVLATLAPDLPAALVDRAAAAAAEIEDPDDRARALAALAPLLPAERRAEALGVAEDPNVLAHLISDLAPHLGEGQLRAALDAAKALEDPTDQAFALSGIVRHLPDAMIDEAFAAIEAIPDDWARERAVMWIEASGEDDEDAAEPAPGRSRDDLVEAIEAAAGEDEPAYRAEALEAITPLLPDDLLTEAVRAALAPVDVSERSELWARLAERPDPEEPARMPAGEHPGALAAAEAIEDAGERAQALAALASDVPAAELAAALERALDHAAATLGSRRLSRAVRVVTPVLPEEMLPGAFAIASRIPRSRMRRRALEDMAGYVATAAPAVQHACFDVALRTSVEHLDVPRFVRALAPIVQRLREGDEQWRRS